MVSARTPPTYGPTAYPSEQPAKRRASAAERAEFGGVKSETIARVAVTVCLASPTGRRERSSSEIEPTPTASEAHP